MANGDSVFDTGTSGVPFTDTSGSPSAVSSDLSSGFSSGLSNISVQAGATAGIGLAGLALGAYGLSSAMKSAKEVSAMSLQQAQLEMQISKQRQQQATLIYQRSIMENFRKTQLARAQGEAAVVAKGGGGGLQSSAFGGGQAQASAQGAFNALGLTQNWQIGQNIFGLTEQIDQSKIAMAKKEADEAEGKAWMSFGMSALSSASNMAKLIPMA